MNHEQLRIISELFMEGRKSYEGMGFMDKPSYEKSVDKAQNVAFQVLRDEVEKPERISKFKLDNQEMLELLKDAGRFILLNCHAWEEKSEGKYETRRRIDNLGNRNYKIRGSGACNKMAGRIYDYFTKINALED